ncbi:sensor histidine kinase [Ornithinibacillus sp. FSL M8-0202]|uniref:sensor histidine kinase n=1 Tax=Ornithinibacillus sp. FSL M8-0202 TaxID=2921616 RepID=UPI0030CFD862
MSKSILRDYVKDRILLLISYLLSIVTIILFHYLSDPMEKEFFYPFGIGVFFLVVFMCLDGAKYYQFHKRIRLLLEDEYAEIHPMTMEQTRVKQLIDKNNRQAKAIHSTLVEQHKEDMAFLSHWIHHLKTPVSVMELIMERHTDERGKEEEYITRLKQENNRLQMRIEQGLTMIRMQRFENDLEVRAVDLVASFREAINERKSEFIYHHVYPVMECSSDSLYVLTDKKWNKILIDQFLSNAIKYSGGKGKQIKISMEIVEDKCLVSIIDQGIGIPSYDIDRIFEPFFTGENGRTERNASGIGLYLARRISEKLGHSLTIQSEVEKGTTVTIQYLTKM